MKEDQVGVALALAGAALNANAVIWCFPIWFVGNLVWMNHWRKKREYAALALSTVFLIMNIYGCIAWAVQRG